MAVHLGFHINVKKKVQRSRIRRTRGPYNWLSTSSYPSTWEIHVQTITDGVSQMNRCTVHLNYKTAVVVVVAELRKSMIQRV
jgi:hypothetical protein